MPNGRIISAVLAHVRFPNVFNCVWLCCCCWFFLDMITCEKFQEAYAWLFCCDDFKESIMNVIRVFIHKKLLIDLLFLKSCLCLRSLLQKRSLSLFCKSERTTFHVTPNINASIALLNEYSAWRSSIKYVQQILTVQQDC